MSVTLDLDHLGIAVRDLDAAAAQFRALGFTLTDKGFHVAAKSPGGPLERTGTGNHCIMLGRGYVELIAVTDPAYDGRLRGDLQRYEGLHLVSFGTEIASETAALFSRTSGLEITPRRLTRPVAERGKKQIAEFDIIDLPDGIAGFGHFFAISHLTREVLWQPHLLNHENGATALLGVLACVADPAAWLHRLAAAIDSDHDGSAIALRQGRVEALDPDSLARRFPGATPPAMPCLAGLVLGVTDIARLARDWRQRGIRYRDAPGRLWLESGDAHGAIIEFVEQP